MRHGIVFMARWKQFGRCRLCHLDPWQWQRLLIAESCGDCERLTGKKRRGGERAVAVDSTQRESAPHAGDADSCEGQTQQRYDCWLTTQQRCRCGPQGQHGETAAECPPGQCRSCRVEWKRVLLRQAMGTSRAISRRCGQGIPVCYLPEDLGGWDVHLGAAATRNGSRTAA